VVGLRASWLGALTAGLLLVAEGPARGDGTPAPETLVGALTGAGVECPQFRLADGEVVSLTGQPPAELGNYKLTGRWARFSYCMEGRTFDVLSFVEIKED